MATIEDLLAAQEAAAKQTAAQKKITAQQTAAAQKAAAKEAGKKATASDAEQSAFLAASTAGSELLQALGDYKRGRISKQDADKKLSAFNASLSALKALNPTRASAVEAAVIPPTVTSAAGAPKTSGTGTGQDPLLIDNKPFTGTKDGKTYTNGVIQTVKDTSTSGQNKPSVVSQSKDTTKKTPSTPPPSGGKMSIDDIYALAQKEFGAIDSIFKTNPELQALMTKALGDPATGKGKYTPTQFLNELKNTNWFKQNATDLQQRGFYKRQYQDQVNAIAANDPEKQNKIDALGQTTEYGRGLEAVKRQIQSYAIAEGAVLDPNALNLLSQDIYDHALEKDPYAIRNYVTAKIKYEPNTILSGQAGKDLADLKATAKANGMDLDKAFGTSIQGWLQKLAQGESVDTYKQIIRNAAKLGMPDKVASLLDNGVDLQTIYDPYRNLMANTLEINPNTIGLDDPTLRSAITPTGETSLYDFAKQLRNDNRWQYTQQAHSEVSNATQQVLKDFGFMG